MPSASNLQIYSLINVYVAGILAAEEASCTIAQATNSQPVKTVAKGYAGESPGAPMTEVTIDMVNPVAGFEPAQLALMNSMDELVPVQFTFYVASNELVFNGFTTNRDLSHAVDTESKISFKARGSYGTFQPLS
jgi:hypothetical protein